MKYHEAKSFDPHVSIAWASLFVVGYLGRTLEMKRLEFHAFSMPLIDDKLIKYTEMKKLLLSVMLLIGIGGCSKEKTPEIPMPKELITEVHISPITEHYYIDDVLTITAKGFLSGDKILFRNKKDVIATIENLTNSKISFITVRQNFLECNK